MKLGRAARFKTNTVVYSKTGTKGLGDLGPTNIAASWLRSPPVPQSPSPPLVGSLDVDSDDLARPGHRVVQIVAELDGELVLARRQLTVEHVLAVAEVH